MNANAESVYHNWPKRRISPALRSDLVDLEVSQPTPAPTPAVCGSEAGMLGALYVIEGSSMGARLIARRVSGLGYHGAFGPRHLAVQLSDPLAFSAFLEILEYPTLSASAEVECVKAAKNIFEPFIGVFNGVPPTDMHV